MYWRFRCPSCGHEYHTDPVPRNVVCSACGRGFSVVEIQGITPRISDDDSRLENFYAGGLR